MLFRSWEAGQAAALVGAAAAWSPAGGLADAHVRFVLFRPAPPPWEPRPGRLPRLNALADGLRQRTWKRQDDVPPALLYLTVRAARRAAADKPDDARAQLLLGEAYLRLLHATRERYWAERLPELRLLRMAQASAALNRAVALQPDLAQAHLALAGLYRDQGYLDLAAHHLGTYLELAKKAGPPPGADASAFREQAAQYDEDLRVLSQQVDDRLKDYASKAAGQRVMRRAELAKERGLAGRARDVLLESDVAAFGFDGMLLELELLLGTGRASEVRDWTEPQHKEALGTAYHWLRAQGMASLGDYAQARQECDALAAALEPAGEQGDVTVREIIASLAARSVLEGMPAWGGLPPFLRSAMSRWEMGMRLVRLAGVLRRQAGVLRRQADTWVLRGVLALEQGEVGNAEDAFRQALALWKDGAGLDFNGRPAAQGYLALLEAARR